MIGKNSIPTHQSLLQSLYSAVYLRKLHFLSFFSAPNLLCILFRHTPGFPVLLNLSVGRQHVITTGRKKVEMVVVTLSADMVFLAFSLLIQVFIKWLPADILCTVLSKVPKYPVFSKIKKFYLQKMWEGGKSAILFTNATKVHYYKIRQVFYYKYVRLFIRKCDIY